MSKEDGQDRQNAEYKNPDSKAVIRKEILGFLASRSKASIGTMDKLVLVSPKSKEPVRFYSAVSEVRNGMITVRDSKEDPNQEVARFNSPTQRMKIDNLYLASDYELAKKFVNVDTSGDKN